MSITWRGKLAIVAYIDLEYALTIRVSMSSIYFLLSLIPFRIIITIVKTVDWQSLKLEIARLILGKYKKDRADRYFDIFAML